MDLPKEIIRLISSNLELKDAKKLVMLSKRSSDKHIIRHINTAIEIEKTYRDAVNIINDGKSVIKLHELIKDESGYGKMFSKQIINQITDNEMNRYWDLKFSVDLIQLFLNNGWTMWSSDKVEYFIYLIAAMYQIHYGYLNEKLIFDLLRDSTPEYTCKTLLQFIDCSPHIPIELFNNILNVIKSKDISLIVKNPGNMDAFAFLYMSLLLNVKYCESSKILSLLEYFDSTGIRVSQIDDIKLDEKSNAYKLFGHLIDYLTLDFDPIPIINKMNWASFILDEVPSIENDYNMSRIFELLLKQPFMKYFDIRPFIDATLWPQTSKIVNK